MFFTKQRLKKVELFYDAKFTSLFIFIFVVLLSENLVKQCVYYRIVVVFTFSIFILFTFLPNAFATADDRFKAVVKWLMMMVMMIRLGWCKAKNSGQSK